MVDPATAVMVPASQLPVTTLGLETAKPPVSVSVKLMPVKVPVAFGFVTVKLRLVAPPTAMVAAPKVFVMVGGLSTVMLAIAVLPVPPSGDATVTELFTTPAVIPVTFTENVQFTPAFRFAPVRLIVVDPGTAVIVPASQLPVTTLGLETTKPPVKVSVKLMPVKVPMAFGFVTVKLKLVVPPTGMVAAPKLFVMLGGPSTVMLAVPAVPVPPSGELACTELFTTPAIIPVTFTVTVQLNPALRFPPVRLIEVDPDTAVTVPPLQAPLTPLGLATTKPPVSVSVKLMPVNAPDELGFVTVKLKLVVPPTGMVAAPKLLVIVGGPSTVKLAVPAVPVPPSGDAAVTELLITPAVVPVTFTENVQVPPPASDAPARLIEVDAATAVMVPLSQVPVTTLGLTTCKPPIKVSVKLMPVKVPVEFGFVTVKLKLVVPPTGMVAAPKLFVILGGPRTVKLAVDLFPPALDVTVTELLIDPAVFPVTLTENVQLAIPASVAPTRLTEDAKGVAVMVPPSQEPVNPLALDTTRPPVNESVKPIPVKLVDAF